MLKASLCTLGTLALLTAGTADAALVVSFGGSGSTRLDPGTGSAVQNVTDISGANSYTTGSLVTTGAGPVTFDLNITSTNGTIAAQASNGLGVSGGSAGQGVDNQNGVLETLAFTISDFTGLGAGESLVITEVELLFGTNGSGGETYTINGGGNIAFTLSPQAVDTPDDVTVTIGAGTQGDTRFAVGSITVEVVPEPSSLALLGLGGLLVARRRRG